ncbi:arsenate reductase (glutaredoxin) [Alteromonas gilva]|uniref:Arsenate reductase n=1 Tax=Alteromonas gilva TaxID=2987522 RepID=A0ABT5L2A3_9ALTE|nr:arsenate reductase (glutaredoxin) [Alteromonas gilva]MDC8831166.1 arsenate reductase (glutaredoxin) [Alteromonas gilva]
MANIKILHNPRCSKSRETLKLLEEKDIAVDIIEYLKTPLTEQEIRSLYTKLDLENVTQMMRVKEPEYKAAGLNSADTTDDQRFAAMVQYPKLIERPVVINGDQAKIGRPPESVLDIV